MPFLFDKPPPLYIPERPAIIRPVKQIATAQFMGAYRIRRLPNGDFVEEMYHAGFWVKVGGATRAFTDSAGNAVSGSSYTFTSRALGSPIGTSLVVVCTQSGDTGNGLTACNSVTIDGTAGTIHAQAHGGSNASLANGVSAIASRATVNSTGNIVCAFNATSVGCTIEIYRLNLLTSATPDATCTATTGTTAGTSISTTLAVTGPGVAIWGAGGRGATMSVGGIPSDISNLTGNAAVGASGSNQSLATQTLSLTGSSSSVAGGGAGASWH